MSKRSQKEVETKDVKEMEETEMTEQSEKEVSEPKKDKDKKKYFTKDKLVSAGKYAISATVGCIVGIVGLSLLSKGKDDDSYDDYYSSYDEPESTFEQPVTEDVTE